MLKKTVVFLLLMCSLAAADSKVEELTESTTPAAADLLYVVANPGPLSEDRKAQISNVLTDTNMSAEDFGGFTCTGAEDGCTVDSDGTWTLHNSYPAACTAGYGATAIGDTLTCADFEEDLSNSLGLASAISDETGTGVVVFGTNPSISTGGLVLGDSSPDAAGEIGYDGELKFYNTSSRTVLHDGSAAESFPDLSSIYEAVDATIMRNVEDDTSPTLGGDLDLDSNWIDATTGYGVRVGDEIAGHYFVLQAFNTGTSAWMNVLNVMNGNPPEMQLQSGVNFTGIGPITVKNADISGAYIDLYEDSDNGTNYVRIRAENSLAANRLVTSMQTKELVLSEPDLKQGLFDAWPIFHVDVDAYQFGITILNCQITLAADAAYTVVFEEWTGDPPAHSSDIESVATSASDSYMEVLYADLDDAAVAADNYVYVDLPTTDVPMLMVEIVFVGNAS